MKNITIELTYDEVKTICGALRLLKAWDEEQLQRKLYCKEVKKNIAKEIEKCMELMKSDGKVYKAWKELWKEARKETI